MRVSTRSGWDSGLGVEHYWAEGAAATRLAEEYAFADETTRQRIDAREEARRRASEQAEKERQAKQAEAEKLLWESKRSRKTLLRYSAADGDRDGSQPLQLVMTDVDFQVPSPSGPKLILFGEITSVERYVGNLYKITPKGHTRIVIRFDSPADLANFDEQLLAALAAWRTEFGKVAR